MPLTPKAPPAVAVLRDLRFALHAPQGYHPERPARLEAAWSAVDRLSTETLSLRTLTAREATRVELERVHSAAYLDRLEQTLRGPAGFIDSDTFFNAHSRDAAWLAAGSAAVMAEALVTGEIDVGALLCRPPGHHACRERAMGFCLLNNVAVAAAHARSLGVPRVAIVDWDVHHGNGTQDIFQRDPSVLLISLHESPLYPMTGFVKEVGLDEGRGRTVNLPLPGASGPGVYMDAFERVVLPVLDAFAPELLLVSAGYDAHARDPLASMQLTAETYGWMAAKLHEVAARHTRGRIGMVLEGGYDLEGVETGVLATLQGLTGERNAASWSAALGDSPRNLDAERAVDRVIEVQRRYWPTLTVL